MLGRLGLNLRVLVSIFLLDPVLRLLANSVLLHPLFRASTAARHYQLYGWRNEVDRRGFTRRRFPLV
jgi:hypothetical protein